MVYIHNRNGASVDDMAEEVNKKKQALDTAMKELKDLKVLNRVGTTSTCT